MPRKKNPQLSVISLGPLVRLYSEAHFLNELRPLGFTTRTLRAFLRALSVPTLHLGSSRFIDTLSLSIALRAVLRIGQPDFAAPGSETIDRASPTPHPPSREISLDFVRSNLETLIVELLAAYRTSSWNPAPTELAEAAKEAARRMIHSGFISLPHAAQEAYTAQAIRAVASDPLDPTRPLPS